MGREGALGLYVRGPSVEGAGLAEAFRGVMKMTGIITAG